VEDREHESVFWLGLKISSYIVLKSFVYVLWMSTEISKEDVSSIFRV
jgi:hypothetical protein